MSRRTDIKKGKEGNIKKKKEEGIPSSANTPPAQLPANNSRLPSNDQTFSVLAFRVESGRSGVLGIRVGGDTFGVAACLMLVRLLEQGVV